VIDAAGTIYVIGGVGVGGNNYNDVWAISNKGAGGPCAIKRVLTGRSTHERGTQGALEGTERGTSRAEPLLQCLRYVATKVSQRHHTLSAIVRQGYFDCKRVDGVLRKYCGGTLAAPGTTRVLRAPYGRSRWLHRYSVLRGVLSIPVRQGYRWSTATVRPGPSMGTARSTAQKLRVLYSFFPLQVLYVL
jgi:hypothetical protein